MRSVANLWQDFWFRKQSALPVALFRVCLGLLVLVYCALLGPDLFTWFGKDSLVPGKWTAEVSLLSLLPQTGNSIAAVFVILILSAFLMMIGFATRISTIVVWICLMSFHLANPFIHNAGDGLIRISTFFMMFAPAGRCLSVDRWLEQRNTPTAVQETELYSPWAQRLLQFEVWCVYWQAFWGKINGAHWQDGTAVYYVTRIDEIRKFHIPLLFENLAVCKFLTWSTLAFEAAFWLLIWFKPVRYPLLLIGLVFHVGLDVTLNIPLFEWMMAATYILFVSPEDWQRWLEKIPLKRATDKGASRNAVESDSVDGVSAEPQTDQ